MLKDFKPTLFILARFILIYLILLAIYQYFLNYYSGTGLDPYSKMITEQVRYIQNYLGYQTQLYNDIKNEQVYFYVRNDYPTRMVEGCNAISVMILFIAFVFAFYKGLKIFTFIIISLILLYILNLLRITGLNIIMTDYKEYGKIAHDFIFPSIIYGGVVILWLIWIKHFVLKDKVSNELKDKI
ncbi:exosortase family protein XrtF [Chryseobacterium candidae]|uniref:Exosortase family protein XrtF n=1 Tax=Chryseobacterium candidae TaxID=1978493 RepID=A0ABY2R4I4_9FLAO|nr:exosortase family protein XrtF [Chryseobacterium candidae]THV57539.1 exosortase family protein XrtF [Chryseobacterium candidae]